MLNPKINLIMLINKKIKMKNSFLMLSVLLIQILAQNRLLVELNCRTDAGWRQTPSIQLSDREILVPTLYNFSMEVDSKDSLVSSYIRNYGTWEGNNINIMAKFIKAGDRVINIGSQSGLEALIMGALIGPTGKMYIFEPYSFSYKLVRKNIYLNNLQDITTVFNVAAGEEQTTATIGINYGNTGNAEVVVDSATNKQRSYYSQQTQNIKVNRVDAILGDEIIDFALIDVERMEVEALLGMKKLIQRSKSKLVLMTEWAYNQNMRKNAAKARQLIDFMERMEYQIFRYTGSPCDTGSFIRVGGFNELTSGAGPFIGLQDIYFIPKGYPFK